MPLESGGEMDEKPPKSTEQEKDNVVNKAEKRTKKALTLLWDDLPAWQRDNHYITSGYRPASNSYASSARSIASLHNETVNIWTHLLGAIIALLTAQYTYHSLRPRFELATRDDVLVFSCFFLGAVTCLGMSATFHTISNHSEAVMKFGNRLDYIGIIFLIWGSFVPSIYYGFADTPGLVRVYWSMITTIGAGTLVVVLYPKFRSSAWRPFRAFMFVAMGLSAVFPVLHGVQIYGVKQLEQQIGLWWLVGQGALYILGAVLYAARAPERWNPGKYDHFGSSHQIFHVLVLLAAATHLVGLLKAFDYEHGLRMGGLSTRSSLFGQAI